MRNLGPALVLLLSGVVKGFVSPLAGRFLLQRDALGARNLLVPSGFDGLRSATKVGTTGSARMMASLSTGVGSIKLQTVQQDMETMGATYCLLWKKRDGVFVVEKDYTTAARKQAMRKIRGDDKLFATESRKYTLPVNGIGPIATAASTGMQVTIKDTSVMQRAGLTTVVACMVAELARASE